MAKRREETSSVNQNILNIITPSGLEFQKTAFVMGDYYSKCLTINRYPTYADYGWLAKITQIEGVTCNVEFSPTDSVALVERCNEQIKELRNDLTTVKDESIRQSKERGMEDIRNMIAQINQDGETVGYVSIVLMVQAETEKKLTERVKKVNSIISAFGGATRILTFKQKEALKWVSPFGITNDRISDFGGRNMPLSTYIGGYVNAASGLNDGVGYMLGSSNDRKPIILDTWKRGGDRTNINWLITGGAGSGKSATVKLIVLSEYALGVKIIFLDPESEYGDMVKALGGKVINCGGGVGGKINPLQVRPAPKMENDDEGIDEYFKNEGKGTSDLALHFQTLRTFVKLYKNLEDLELAKFEEILEKTYARFGIVWKTDITQLKSKDFPIFSDFYEDLKQELEKDTKNPVLQNLVALFRSISEGADQFIFNGHTDIEFDTDIIDLDISALIEADENVLRAQFHNINSYVWQFIANDRSEKVLYIIDEGYLIVDEKNPEALIFVKNVSKRIRKYLGGLVFITQSVVDILDPAVKRHGQALIDNACYKMLMGTDGKNLKETKDLFDLTEAEEALLASKQRGRGILFAGAKRIATRVEIPEAFMRIMGKAGGK